MIKWAPVNYSDIADGYLISPSGKIVYNELDERYNYESEYQSTNGRMYASFLSKHHKLKLYPIDMILASSFIPIPKSLINKDVTVKHIDGDMSNNDLENLIWIEDVEEWRVVTYPDIRENMYAVSSFGRIKNIETNLLLKNQSDRGGYRIIWLAKIKPNTGVTKKVHRIMAHEFIMPLPEIIENHLEVNHIDGDKNNNHLDNLELITSSENQKHAFRLGLHQSVRGENKINSKLSNETVEKICQYLVKYNGNISKVLAEFKSDVNVKYYLIRAIKYKHIWSFISDKYFMKDEFRVKTSDDKIHLICQTLVDNNMSVARTVNELKEIFPEITHRYIYPIKYKFSWTHISDLYF